MNPQLTVQKSRRKLDRDVCHGKRGTIHQAYRDGMEEQLGARPGPQRHRALDDPVHRRRRCPAPGRGNELREEDIARLSRSGTAV